MIQIVHMKVPDYDGWKRMFDERADVRAQSGCLGHTIYRDVDDPSELTIIFEFATRVQGDEYMRSHSLAEALKSVGVASVPSGTWVDEVEDVIYGERRAA
jgi:hypothetical protein